MDNSNKKFLDESRYHYDSLIKNGFARNINLPAMIEVYNQEFEPDFKVDKDNPERVLELIVRLYKKYDEWLLANKKWKPKPTNRAAFEKPKEEKKYATIEIGSA